MWNSKKNVFAVKASLLEGKSRYRPRYPICRILETILGFRIFVVNISRNEVTLAYIDYVAVLSLVIGGF